MDQDKAKKALDELKTSIKSELGEELAQSLSKDISGVVSKQVTDKIEAELKDIKASQKSEDEKERENWKSTVKAFKNLYEKQILNKDLDTSTTSSGAELIPEYFGNEVIRVAQNVGVARNNARVITLPGKTYNLPGFGNVTAYRTDEKSSYTASGLSTSQTQFSAKKLTALVIMTREAIEDANVDVVKWVTQLSGEGVARKEDEWAYLGLASGEGIFQNTSVPTYTLGTGDTTYSSLDFDDLLGALALVDDGVVQNLKWVGSFSVFNDLRGTKDSNGQYIFQNPGAGMPNTIWGRPYLFSTVMPKTSDGSQAGKNFLAAYDPRYLMIGDRRRIEVEFSKEATVTSSDGSTTINLFEQDYVAVKVSERIDIQLAEPSKAFVKVKTATA
ncbi:MAG: phage major capsid protein [Cyanobacteria bacterium J149]|nr:MAG: phage major capsid protein [Cyanobacteria bacterium J149]